MHKFPRFSAIVALLSSAALIQTGAAQNIGTALVNGAPQINSGTVEGNVRQMTGANVTLNGASVVTGDLLVPGTPTLVLNGTPIFGGVIVGSGSASPSNYQVILNGGVRLGHLRNRTNPIPIPTVPPMPTPAGTRSVTISAAGQTAGNFATLRNLTLNGNVGQFAIPAGTYGDFAANGGSGFTLGVAGSQQPAVYNLQRLTLNGQTSIIVLGPVVINLANAFTANGAAGTSSNPAWLKLNIKTGAFTVNGGCTIHGYATVPNGRITINGAGKLIGGATCKDLTVNGNGLLRLFDIGSFENHPPVAANQSLSTGQDTAKPLVLSATDPDGQALTYLVVAQPAHGSLSGAAPQLIYAPAPGYFGPDSFTFKANDGQVDSNVATVSITVTRLNHAPLANPRTLTLNQNAAAPVVLTGSDVDGDQLTFRVTSAPAHGVLSGSPPNLVYTPSQNFYGTDSFTFVANDGARDSSPATVSITVNHPPIAQGQNVQTNENTVLAILLTATDPDSGAIDYTVIAPPTFGVLSGTPPNLTYTPAAGFFGSDHFTFRANDGSASSATATIQITVVHVNRPPIANGQNRSLDEDGTLAVGLTGNDVDGDNLLFTIIDSPQHGALSGTAPNLTYTPVADFHGADAFTFVASDAELSSAPAIVALTVNPVNDGPVINASAPAQITAPEIIGLNALVSDDGDPAGSVLTVRWSKTSGPGDIFFTDETQAITTASYTQAGTYLLRATASDGELSATDDVEVTVLMPNRPPEVSAGANQTTGLANAANLAGSVQDDGLPEDATVTQQWSKVSGPGTVTFGNATALATTANFDTPGDYVLRLRASDSALFGQAQMTVHVLAPNQPPQVNAGPAQNLPADVNTASLAGHVTDDGLPRGPGLQSEWIKVSGPGEVTFGNVFAAGTSATFSEAGMYVLRLSATDSELSASAETQVVIAPRPNQAPVVNAGADQELIGFGSTILQGTITDDGLPAGTILTQKWTKVSGPGAVIFGDASARSTVATFSETGVYVVRLTADDTALTAFDEITVTVDFENKAPAVDAGPDQTGHALSPLALSGEVIDDGLPAGAALTATWSKVSGPGTISFSNASSITTSATFSDAGVYVLQLSANDSELTANDQVTVEISSACTHPPGGLVGWWSGNGNAQDAAGTSHGTLLNEVTFSTGKVGDAFTLNGSSSVRAPASPAMDVGVSTGLTIELWINPNNAASQQPLVEWHNGSTFGVHLWLSTFGEANLYANIVGSDGWYHNFYSPPGLITSGSFQHVAVTYDRVTGLAVLYKDGQVAVQQHLGTFIPLTSYDLYFGYRPGNFFTGTLDEVSVYQRALRQDEIQSIYQASNGGKCTDAINRPPIVQAGIAQAIPVSYSLQLQGSVSDDGRPAGAPISSTWSVVSGPGAVFFADGSVPTTNVTFSTPGTYVLRLTATDSELTMHGDVTISVVADDQPVSPTVTIIPYQASDWRYKIYPLGGVPPDAGALAFDDSDYALGRGAFGSGGGCTVQSTVHTSWPTFTEIVLRRTIDMPANVTNVRVSGTIDNDVRVLINGADASGGFLGHEWCPELDDTRINVVTTSLTPGPNLFVVQGRDRGGESFVDVRLLVDQPVTADAGPDATVAGESLVTLDGSDSTAFSGSPLTFQWTQLSGPAVPLDVSDPVHPHFVAPTNSANLVFTFRLIVNDGRITSSPDTVAITVSASGVNNLAPVVSAGSDQTSPSSTAILQGAVHDDGIPSPALLAVAWTAVSGPGPVSFANAADPATTAQFTRPGVYTLRLSASDSQLVGSDEIVITVPTGVNLPPSVNAGPDRTVTFPQTASLSAQVSDDGLPNGTLTSRWMLFSGPGQVTFEDAFATSTVASFTVPGTYVLRFIASDSVLNTTDDVTVTVAQAANQPPTADAGPNLSIPFGQSVTLTGLADDDGLPNGWLIIHWSLAGGPAAPQFSGTFEALTVTFPQIGVYVLRFTANDGEFTASDDVVITVSPSNTQPPLVSLTAPTQNAVFNSGQLITLTATASDPDAGGAVLSVEFYVDGSLVGSAAPDANGSARYEWSGASLGGHSITAVATDISGTPATSAPVNISVQTARPTVALTYPSNYSAFAPGELVQLHATATAAPGASITSVEFMVNGAPVGSDATSPYATMWTTPATAGEYTLTAIANDEAGQATSAPVLIRVVTDPDEPLVAEFDPAQAGMVVTAPTTLLGTVSGATLASWIVEYRQTGVECADWVSLATGVQAVTGPLAAFDPTLLLNGTYEVRLTVRNAFGGAVSTDARVIVDGNMKVGNFTATFKDMELPLAGVPITITRTYDSRNHCPGDFGYGWTLDVDSIRLESTEQMGDAWSLFIHVGTPYDPSYYRLDDDGPHLISLKMPGGKLLRFTPKLVMDRPYNRLASLLDADGDDIGQVYAPIQDDQPIKLIYRARAGTEGAVLKARGYRTISPFAGVGTVSSDTQLFLADTFEGAISLATQPGQFGEAPAITHVTGWEVTLKDGRVLLFDAEGKLEEMRDRVGNKVSFHRLSSGRIERITHLPSEKEIVFQRDTAGRIQTITDPRGHAAQYFYTPNGDLKWFFERGNDPANSTPTTRFTYIGATHLLEDILDARGIRATKNFYDEDDRLYKTIDAEGKETIFTHDLNTRTETIRDRANNITVHRYDERGNITQTQAPDGTITTTDYHRWSDGTLSELKEADSVTGLFTDENNAGGPLVTKILTTFYSYEDEDPATPPANDGLLRKLVDPKGNTTTFTYDGRGNVLTVTDARANAAGGTPAASVANTYYDNGLLQTATDALGRTTSYTYDAQGNPDTQTRVVTLINVDGSSSSANIVTDRDYNTLGQLEQLTNPAGHVTTYEYDANNNCRFERTTRTTSTGAVIPVVTETEYDEQDRPVFTWNADNPRGQAARPSTQTVYDGNGKVDWTYDALGRGTHQEYDSRGLLFKTTHPDTTFETITYDPEGRREISRDRRAMATQTVYDPMGRVRQTIFLGDGSEAAVALSTTRYDAAGRVWQSVDANNNTTTYGYDDAGRRTTVVSPPVPLSGGGMVSPTTRYSYDPNGNLRFVTDPKGAVTEHLYDALNRRWKTILPTAALDVNGDGLIGSGEQSVAGTMLTGYDELGRRVSETDASNRTKRYGYDVLGRLRHVLEFANQATRFDYDELGNQLSQTDANQHTTLYSYDNAGRRLTRTLPLGQQEVLGYDDAGNLQTRRDFNGKTTNFQYDPMNRLRFQIPDASLGEPTIEFTYNNNGQRETMSDATGTTIYGYDGRGQLRAKRTPFGTLSYTYWPTGSLRQMWSSNANGTNVSYGYDALNRLATVTDANAGTTSCGYDRNSNLESVLHPNAVNHAYGYNSLNRLTGLSVVGGTGPLAGYGYVGTPAGQRTSVSEATGRVASYGYDNLGRLQRETITGSPDGKNGMATYGYDNVGNRLTRTSSIAGITSQTLGYDSNDRLSGDQYDNNGNTIAGTVSQPLTSSTPQPLLGIDSYDSENRLVQRTGTINGQPSTINLLYDGDGNRVREIVNGQIRIYLVDDRNPTGYAQVVEEIVNGVVNHTYTYGHDLISQDQFDGTTGAWRATFYGYDGRGNVRLLTDETGAVTDTYTYDAFGTLITTTGSTNNRYLYSGEQFDPNLGLYYLRARLMNPVTGRFWCMDTYEGDSSGPISLHKYLYADTDPTNRSDPSGNFSLVEVNTATGIATTISGVQANIGFAVLGQIEDGGNAGFKELVTEVGITLGAGVLGKLGFKLWKVFATGAKVAERGEGRYLYRTIKPSDPHYAQFRSIGDTGTIAPRGGHNDLTKHVQQNETNSVFISWSKNKDANWEQWGEPGAVQLRVDVAKMNNAAIDVSEWSHFPMEEEVTVIGTMIGIERIR